MVSLLGDCPNEMLTVALKCILMARRHHFYFAEKHRAGV